ncbi:MAG: RNA polymerase sigma-70 factor [Candidatus Pedobacter colombiensis]|uniref:RNA polymerase sigma-70 factor n=1 Tax=Candidatus Pedobacter colombiensis TaxID=3121371 RepID=A0AAJ5WAU0_9SPHI|nr:RNA polymerase sigma-70 factor [Pedobacter sp.]WEK20563.1 MAG: RNA polymerase sigma-70 factor [Pedobacter sp.]
MTPVSSRDERLLLKQIAEGDEDAFAVLFYRYLPILQPFAIKFTKSAAAAEEIIQDTFLRVWLNREKLESIENVKAWLYKYASNECLNYLRKELKQAKAIDSLGIDHPVVSNDTVDKINLNDINCLVAEAVEKLPGQRKKIYQMSRAEGMNIPEIAEALNLSPNTIKNALVISLKTIREHLNKNGVALSVLAYIALLK